MKTQAISCLSTLFLSLITAFPVHAQGEITIQQANGETQTYSEVEIFNTENILYFQSPDTNSILMITKKECNYEDQLLVCNRARMGLDTNGVIEEFTVKQIVLFINPTQKRLPIQGSSITMGPQTILLEAVTGKGTYVTGLGTIDKTTKPTGVSP